MNKAEAFIFDLNGTMIDDMQYHGDAWFNIVTKELGANLTYQEVAKEMYGKNEEVLIRIFGKDKFSKEEMQRLSIDKEKRYQTMYKPHLKLINGLEDFIKKAAEQHIKMAIGSAAIPFNIDFVLDNLNLRHYFSAIVSADDVVHSKPDPETFVMAANKLHVKPQNCIVFEDAPKGVESAMNAGMKAIVITTMHGKEEFEKYDNVLGYINNYHDNFLDRFFL